MTRAVVCVATTPYYQRGQFRLLHGVEHQSAVLAAAMGCRIDSPRCEFYRRGLHGWPSHQEKPYAFKAYSLKREADRGADLLLWCDACMLPVQSMEPLWQRIERDGYWMSRNGWNNYQWTADSAYPDLFSCDLNTARAQNKAIPHVVATCFGLNVKHPKGRAFLDEYYRLASETRAFCGPWTNLNAMKPMEDGKTVSVPLDQFSRVSPCGPPDVLGHRHDQTAASVIAWRLGFELTDPPEIFAYGKAGEQHDPRTIMIADGSYV